MYTITEILRQGIEGIEAIGITGEKLTVGKAQIYVNHRDEFVIERGEIKRKARTAGEAMTILVKLA